MRRTIAGILAGLLLPFASVTAVGADGSSEIPPWVYERLPAWVADIVKTGRVDLTRPEIPPQPTTTQPAPTSSAPPSTAPSTTTTTSPAGAFTGSAAEVCRGAQSLIRYPYQPEWTVNCEFGGGGGIEGTTSSSGEGNDRAHIEIVMATGYTPERAASLLAHEEGHAHDITEGTQQDLFAQIRGAPDYYNGYGPGGTEDYAECFSVLYSNDSDYDEEYVDAPAPTPEQLGRIKNEVMPVP